jgi:hypothetical protein
VTAPSDALRSSWASPHPSRLPDDHPFRDEILDRHRAAMAAGDAVYADPASGLSVFTAAFLAGRGTCCGSGCRHCPYSI